MGRVFRIWRGDWKKNEQDQWYFVPNHGDYGFTMYMDPPETFPVIDSTVRECFMLGSDTPLLITYGMLNWMLFPSGPTSLIRIATTEDLVSLINQRPPLTDITLLCTFGSKSVAEFQFLSRSDFTIGSSTYVVGEGQDERARARYESLVLGQRLVVSESVMREIFVEEEMVILHGIAMEMAYADRILGRGTGEGVVRRMEIIHLDDDAEMVDVSQNVVAASGSGPQSVGSLIPFQPKQLPNIIATNAPSFLYDVGVDLFDYPEVYNTQSGGRQLSEDAAFWKAVIEANQEPDEEVLYIASENEIRVGLGPEETRMGVIGDPCGDSLSSVDAIVCTQLGPEVTTNEKGGDGIEVVDLDGIDETNKSNTAETVKVSVVRGSAAGGGPIPAAAKACNTSSEGSESEGGF